MRTDAEILRYHNIFSGGFLKGFKYEYGYRAKNYRKGLLIGQKNNKVYYHAKLINFLSYFIDIELISNYGNICDNFYHGLLDSRSGYMTDFYRYCEQRHYHITRQSSDGEAFLLYKKLDDKNDVANFPPLVMIDIEEHNIS
jgi:hypothetical protein